MMYTVEDVLRMVVSGEMTQLEAARIIKAHLNSTEPSGTWVPVPIALAKYAIEILQESREGLADLDGGYLQDVAESTGVIEAVRVTEPCDHGICRCAEDGGDFPMDCYRYTKETKQAMRDIKAAAPLPPERGRE